ncbi:MAG TPA: NUDIX hydrolase [Patescibacteria group bacterium]|nr:NUDIX hydrolase [Patescibacteria group bacterium]
MNDQKKWKLLDTQKVFGSPWVSLENRNYELSNGLVKNDYLHLNRPDYVLIVVLDGRGRLLVERQYRRGVDDFVYELPAGWIEKGESPSEAAKRELLEETGVNGSGDTCFELYPQPGFSSMKAYVCILNIDTIGTAQVGEDEDISTMWIALEDVQKMVKESKIKDMGFLAALSLVDHP